MTLFIVVVLPLLLFLLLLTSSVSSDEEEEFCWTKEEKDLRNAPIELQPALFRSTLELLHNKPLHNKHNDHILVYKTPPGCTFTSNLTVKEKQAVPDSQGWAHCSHCGVKDGMIALLGKSSHINQVDSTSSPIDISWSLWGEFFHKYSNDQYTAQVLHHRTL